MSPKAKSVIDAATPLARDHTRHSASQRIARDLRLRYWTVVNILRDSDVVFISAQQQRDGEHGMEETPAQARARVKADIATGVRCPDCWLLKDCGGHAYEATGGRQSWVDIARST